MQPSESARLYCRAIPLSAHDALPSQRTSLGFPSTMIARAMYRGKRSDKTPRFVIHRRNLTSTAHARVKVSISWIDTRTPALIQRVATSRVIVDRLSSSSATGGAREIYVNSSRMQIQVRASRMALRARDPMTPCCLDEILVRTASSMSSQSGRGDFTFREVWCQDLM